MADCRHHEICGLEVDESTKEDFCVLHSHNLEKNLDLFRSALEKHRNSPRRNNFSFFVFPVLANFIQNKFTETEGVDFSGAEFAGEADFSGATFAKATFVGAKFTKMANFRGAIFTEVANFNGVKFAEVADFSGGAMFMKRVDFSDRTTFTKTANFEGAIFTDVANFNGVIFKEEANFSGKATFTKRADFGGSHFTMLGNFEYAKFDEWADFQGATFEIKAKFNWATFEEADFDSAVFIKGANFEWATFVKGAHFDLVKFAVDSTFEGACFLGRTIFAGERRKYPDPDFPIFEDAAVNFKRATIEPLGALRFRTADLRKCQFLYTDLRGAEFTNVKWPVISKRDGVFDEISPSDNGGFPFPETERLYRELKQNYEDRRDYERAGDFHYGEKEMRRKNPETALSLKVFLTLYWAVSGFGERYLRPLVWTGILLIVCAYLYLLLGIGTPGKNYTKFDPNKCEDWLQSIHYSFRVMTLLKADDMAKAEGGAKIVSTFQSLLGPLFLGLFGLALRQRLKR
jgi:uncharacterized protein YjbI with pentapeptide repeats